MRAVPYESLHAQRLTRQRRVHRGRAVRQERWPIGSAMLVAVFASIVLWSVFGAALYWVSS